MNNSIYIKLNEVLTELSAGSSKFWGSPIMPDSFDYPSYIDDDGEEGTYDFICQINCADIADFDADGILPHKGMLYFFGKIGYYAGNFWEEPQPSCLWDKHAVKVVYTPRTDFENFIELVLTDEDDNEVAYPEKSIEFLLPKGNDASDNPFMPVHKLLGSPDYLDDLVDLDKYMLLFQLDSCEIVDGKELNFMDEGMLYFLVPKIDLLGEKRTFKNARGFLASS